MTLSRNAMWALLAVAAGVGFAAVWMSPARHRWEAQRDDSFDQVDEASDESFPASDPPAFSAPQAKGGPVAP